MRRIRSKSTRKRKTATIGPTVTSILTEGEVGVVPEGEVK